VFRGLVPVRGDGGVTAPLRARGARPTVSAVTDAARDAGSIRRRATGAVAVLTARGAVIFAIGFVANVALVRLLGPRQFGLLALGGAISGFAAAIVDGGLGAGLIRGREVPEERTLASVVGAQIAVTSAFALVIGIAAIAIGGEVLALASVMAMSLSVIALRLPAIIILERELRYGPIARVDLLAAIAYYALAIPLALVGAGAWAIVLATLGSQGIATGALIAMTPEGRVWPRLELRRVRPLLRFGMQYQAVGIVQTVRDQLVSVLSAAFGGLVVAGFLSLLRKLLALPSVVTSPMSRVGFSSFARAVDGDDEHARLLDRSATSLIVPLGAVFVGLAATAQPLVALLFGPAWEATANAVPWACFGGFVDAITWIVCANYLFAVGSAKPVLWANVGYAAAMIITVVMLASPLGIVGIGIAWFVGCGIEGVILCVVADRRSRGNLLWPIVGSSAVVVGASLVGTVVATQFSDKLVACAMSGAAGVGAFLIAMAVVMPSSLKSPVGLLRRFWSDRQVAVRPG
jgi:O-antigen/teichoic acid export membrane protein